MDLNFSGIKNYPTLVPQRLMALKFESVVDACNKLGMAQMMTPDAELEAWFRKQIGAPEQAADAGTGDDPETGDKADPVDRPGETKSETPAAPQKPGAGGQGSGGGKNAKRAGGSQVQASESGAMNIQIGRSVV